MSFNYFDSYIQIKTNRSFVKNDIQKLKHKSIFRSQENFFIMLSVFYPLSLKFNRVHNRKLTKKIVSDIVQIKTEMQQ